MTEGQQPHHDRPAEPNRYLPMLPVDADVLGAASDAARSVLENHDSDSIPLGPATDNDSPEISKKMQTSEIPEPGSEYDFGVDSQMRLIAQGSEINRLAAEYRAKHDQLSGLLNRRGFDEGMDKLLANAQSGQVGLVYLDIDKFKSINDTWGHARGDVFIQDFSKWLTNKMSTLNGHSEDLVARLGGDEFVIAVNIAPGEKDSPQDPNDFLDLFAGQLLESFEQEFLNDHPAIKRKKVSFSWGGAIYEDGLEFSDLMDMADREMYDRKHGKKRAVKD